MFLWKGVNQPPPSVLDIPVIKHLEDLAAHNTLRDTTSYGSGLRKFHRFCDVFSIPEEDRLPASFPLLHSFALWAAADPDDPALGAFDRAGFEPVSHTTVRKYLSAVRAWHLAQGWQAPLSEHERERIERSLRGLANLQGTRRLPPRPPITLEMLATLKQELNLDDPFDACVWAMAVCAFWGLMRFGEVSVKTRDSFNPAAHLTRGDAFYGTDDDGKAFFRLVLRAAKTAQPGEVQHVTLLAQGLLCPIDALFNLARVVPTDDPDAPLFSWRDRRGAVRPMVRAKALARINEIMLKHGWGTSFGHSFRIGGASFLLAHGVAPEIVRIAGRWKSLAYEVYIRAFERIASRHFGDIVDRKGAPTSTNP